MNFLKTRFRPHTNAVRQSDLQFALRRAMQCGKKNAFSSSTHRPIRRKSTDESHSPNPRLQTRAHAQCTRMHTTHTGPQADHISLSPYASSRHTPNSVSLVQGRKENTINNFIDKDKNHSAGLSRKSLIQVISRNAHIHLGIM